MLKKKNPGTSAAGVAKQNDDLRARLAEAEETLRAIRDGEVDALVVSRPEGDQVFTLQGADTTYRFLVEEMNEGALLLEPGGTVLYANARFADMAGVPLEQVSGGPWDRLFVAEARVSLGRLFREAKSGPVRGDFELSGGDGPNRPVSVSLCSMQRNGMQGVCAVVTDLTERKVAEDALRTANNTLEARVRGRTAELQRLMGNLQKREVELEEQNEELRKSEERYRTLFESIDEGFCTIEVLFDEDQEAVDYRVLTVNPAFERQTGIRDGVGRRMKEIAPAHEKHWFRTYGGVALTGKPSRFEHAAKELGRYFDVYAFRIGPPSAHTVALLFNDISVRKQAEAVLKRDKEELERLVAEGTSKLNELVGELEHFSYTITHDLKSPLRAMRGFSEMMMSTTCVECEQVHAKELLGRISTSAKRMDGLIADALSYSRSVRQDLPLEEVDTGDLLRGMLDSYPELQPDKARIRVDGRLPMVLANEAGLTQCFSNLLGNAVKFVKAGEAPEIRVWAEVRGDAGTRGCGDTESWVRIWVEDKGIGIAQKMLPRVFDMFARGSKDHEGTGIGLALVRKVAQRMGGRVGVESEEGKGCRFWIELKSGERKAHLTGATARKAEEPGAGGDTVLYVEDEESDAVFMERAFAGKGLSGRLRMVADGQAAINYLAGSGEYNDREKYPVPAVVVLDLNLPHVPGFEVLQWMRNHPDFAKTPVVVFSSSTREDDWVKAQRLGANEFVSKPSSSARFGEVVEVLRGKWMGKG